MVPADYIALAALVVSVVLGVGFGFGKGLKFFTSGIFGVSISIFVCYLIFGFVLDWDVVGNLLGDFNNWLREQGSLCIFCADI